MLYTKDGTRKLGTHTTKKEALGQEAAINISKVHPSKLKRGGARATRHRIPKKR